MASLNEMLSSFLRTATQDISIADYVSAKKNLLEAAKCALSLAKQSRGAEQQKYIKTVEVIKGKIEEIEAKISAENNSSKGKGLSSDTYSGGRTYEAPKPTPPVNNTPPANNGYVKSEPPAKKKDQDHFTGALMPKRLKDYIGQPQAVTAVKDLIDAALLKGSALPHIILYGSHGLGKTTFSNIIANEMGAKLIEVNVTNVNPASMITILKEIEQNDILFIDEIHTLPLQVAESVLYSAMQDGKVTYTEGKGKTAKTETLYLPPFTLIGATTEIGKLAKPFIQRAIQVRLVEYTDEVLARIITSSFYKLGMKISEEMALKISKRCRNNPRIANNTVKRISDKALVKFAAMNNIKDRGAFSSAENIKKYGIEITENVINEFLEENGIDEYGLEKADRELLRIIITRYDGGPVGIDTLARVLNEANNVISQKYEAYLIKKGMLKIEREGRVVMPLGYKALNMPVPGKLLDLEKSAAKNDAAQPKDPEQSNGKYDRRKTVASHVQDELKCQRIENLIVYPDNAGQIDTPLDELFPDVEKPYEAETKHSCELEIDFGDWKRLIVCDSFLESRFATALAGVGYLQDMKAQSLEIPYISQRLANRRYFPDFAIKDYKGRIAIIEMKNFDAACYHLNIDKYEKLAEYCEQKGYGYAEIMKAYNADEYISIDNIKKRPVNHQLEDFIISRIEENASTGEAAFTTKDWEDYNRQYGEVDKTEIYTVLLNNRRLRNTDRNGTGIIITID